jgi:hypothetical protein
MELLGYIEKKNENDVKLAKDIIENLDHKLTRRNLLVYLCQIEKILLPWMKTEITYS